MEVNKKNKILNVPNLRFVPYSNSWLKISIKECGKVITGSTPSTKDPSNYGDAFPFVGPGDLGSSKYIITAEKGLSLKGSHKGRIIKTDSVLVTCIGSTIGKTGISKTVLFTNQQINTIECFDEYDPEFIYYSLEFNFVRYLRNIETQAVPIISKSSFEKFTMFVPNKYEQSEIGCFMALLDKRIETQNKIIEKYESLIKQLNDDLFSREINCKIGDFIQECSKRNKDGAILNVLSVSNKNGFVKQSEQFEDKELASEDKTNYKIVQKGDFAFNPARINVGSIALLKKQETGIVSPMYICFKAKNIPNEVLESYFSSSSFKKEMNKRLEGSVRMCLTIDGMKYIRFHNPDEKEVNLLNYLTKLKDFVSINKKILDLYNSQKKYLLSNLFI